MLTLCPANLDHLRIVQRFRSDRMRAEMKAAHEAGPEEYLSSGSKAPPPGLPSVGKGSGVVLTDAARVSHPMDLRQLRMALAGRAWTKQGGKALLDRLAQELLHPVRMARAALPPLKMKPTVPAKPKGAVRKRRPGGGRKRNEPKAILAAGVKAAMQECGLKVGVWHRNGAGGASPYLQAVAICWSVASGEPVRPKEDLSWLVARGRRWNFG